MCAQPFWLYREPCGIVKLRRPIIVMRPMANPMPMPTFAAVPRPPDTVAAAGGVATVDAVRELGKACGRC